MVVGRKSIFEGMTTSKCRTRGRWDGVRSNIGGDLSVFLWDVEAPVEIDEVADAVHDGGVKDRISLVHEVEQGLGDG